MAKSLICFVVAITLAATNRVSASEPIAASPVASPSTQDANEGKLIVHEWGTFTTFSGSDGVFLEFRPLDPNHNDLPNYVLDRGSYSTSPDRLFAKSRLRGRVRMETPVTYFYVDRHRTVEVRVDFPQGLLTEFYPPVRKFSPEIDEENIFGIGERMGKSSLNWGTVDLIPVSELVPNMRDSNLRKSIASSIVTGLVPHASNEQHYAAARETDSAIVHFRESADKPSYFEKFLFYRGVGKFQLPITTHFADDRPILSNSGSLTINSAILIDVQGDEIQAMRIKDIKSGQSLPFDDLNSVSADELAKMVRESLVAEGLYQKEAESMVATWQQSWITENGMRVLYMVPGPTTNTLLPLHIKPTPDQMLRVLVGRMEIMSPTREKEMTTAVARSVATRARHIEMQTASGTQEPYVIPENIHAFGRMTEPALARIALIAKNDVIRNEAEMLFRAFQSDQEMIKN